MDSLSKQDQEFVKEIAITDNGTQSAKKAYGIEDDNYANVKAQRKIRKDTINTAIQEVKSKLADNFKTEDIARKINEGLEAGKIKEDGMIEPDYAVRHKYVETVVKIRGDYAPDKSINVNLQAEITNPKARELAEEYENRLKQGL